jgi:hypothetical protein
MKLSEIYTGARPGAEKTKFTGPSSLVGSPLRPESFGALNKKLNFDYPTFHLFSLKNIATFSHFRPRCKQQQKSPQAIASQPTLL